MQLGFSAVVIAAFVSPIFKVVDACIVVHVMFEKCGGVYQGLTGSNLYVEAEMYDDGVQVCTGAHGKMWDSNDWYPISCGPGYGLAVGPRGNEVEMHSPNGYHKIMQSARSNSFAFPGCGDGWGTKEGPKPAITGHNLETCYYDGYWNCDQFPGCAPCRHQGPGSCRPAPHGRWIELEPNMTSARPTPFYGDSSDARILPFNVEDSGTRAVVFTA